MKTRPSALRTKNPATPWEKLGQYGFASAWPRSAGSDPTETWAAQDFPGAKALFVPSLKRDIVPSLHHNLRSEQKWRMAIHIRRREFIFTLGGAAAAWPLAARAQNTRRAYRIGFLGVTSRVELAKQVEAPGQGFASFGYEEGINITIHFRSAESRYDRLPELAAELVRLNVDVLVVYSTPGARAAKQVTRTVPVVMAVVGDPVAAGLVTSLARPDENLTGLTFYWKGTSRIDQGSYPDADSGRCSSILLIRHTP